MNYLITSLFVSTLLFYVSLCTEPNPSMCYPNSPQCKFHEPYFAIIRDRNSPISWFDAKKECQKTFGMESTLAYINPKLKYWSIKQQFKKMRDICRGYEEEEDDHSNHDHSSERRSCWIGGYHSKDWKKNNQIWNFLDENNEITFTFNKDLQQNIKKFNTEFWGCIIDEHNIKDDHHCEPTGGKDEKCLTLFAERDFFMADWPCIGSDNLNKFITSDILCTNPNWSEDDPSTGCECQCDVCNIIGDPHITTFDKLHYHPMGNCSYHYVTPCFYNKFNKNFPFDITGNHEMCFNSENMSCLKSLYITFYDPDYYISKQKPAVIIEIGHELTKDKQAWNTFVKFLECKECKYSDWKGDVPFNHNIHFYEKNIDTEPWSFRIERGIVTDERNFGNIIFRFYGISEWEQMRIEMRDITGTIFSGLYLSEAKIYLSQCLKKQSCGLCGYYDGNKNNDFVIRKPDYKGKPDFKNRISTDGVSNIRSVDAFKRSQQFSSQWKSHYSMFMDRNQNCISSEPPICPWDLCVTKCEKCPHIDGKMVYQDCTVDLCACMGDKQKFNEIDEEYNIKQIFGKTTSEIMIEIKNNPKETKALRNKYFKLLGKRECLDIVDCACARDQCFMREECGPTPSPTIEPTPKPTEIPSYPCPKQESSSSSSSSSSSDEDEENINDDPVN